MDYVVGGEVDLSPVSQKANMQWQHHSTGAYPRNQRFFLVKRPFPAYKASANASLPQVPSGAPGQCFAGLTAANPNGST